MAQDKKVISKTTYLGNGRYRLEIDPTFQVGASSDDCQRIKSSPPDSFSLTPPEVDVGYWTSSCYKYGSGMRFTNVTIPQGATILDGTHLTLRCNYTISYATVKSRISAENVDDAPTFANDKAAFDTRYANRTTARVDWDNIPAWTLNTDYNSPEIKAVIQEIINRAGWASGNDIVIFWEDFDNRSIPPPPEYIYAYRGAYSYDGSATYAPKLVIEYTAGQQYQRSGTALLGLKGAGTRGLVLTRSKTGLLGLLPSGTRSLGLSRSNTALLGLKGIASRTIALTRVKTALLGLKGIMSLTEEQLEHDYVGVLYNGDITRRGQRKTILDTTITKLGFFLAKCGSPTGDVSFTIRKVSDDSIIASKVWGDASDLPTDATYKEITFDNPAYVNEEIRFSVEFYGGDPDNDVETWYQEEDVKGGEYLSTFNSFYGTWTNRESFDHAYIYTCVGTRRVLSLNRSKTVLLGLKGIGSKVISRVRAGTGLLGLKATATKSIALTRSQTALLGLKALGSRTLTLTRLDTALLGLKTTGTKIRTYIKAGTALLGLKTTATKTISYTRSKTALLGLLATGSRTIDISRSSVALLGLKATGIASTMGHYVREGIAYLGLVATGTRSLTLARSKTALLGLKGTGSRVLALTKVGTALLGLVSTATRVITYTRIQTALLGLKTTATRTISITRVKTALLGLKATGIAVLPTLGKLVVKVITLQYRNIVVGTSQHRLIKVITSQYRKIRAILLGE